LIRKKCKQGDIVKITLDGGREITGTLDEISSEHLTLIVDECPVVLTHKIIVLFEIVKKQEISRVVATNAPVSASVKPAESKTTTQKEEIKEISPDEALATSQPVPNHPIKKVEFTKDLITGYNDALVYCLYLDSFDISSMVTQLDFKYDNPSVSRAASIKKFSVYLLCMLITRKILISI